MTWWEAVRDARKDGQIEALCKAPYQPRTVEVGDFKQHSVPYRYIEDFIGS
jgi:hypothetical protein